MKKLMGQILKLNRNRAALAGLWMAGGCFWALFALRFESLSRQAVFISGSESGGVIAMSSVSFPEKETYEDTGASTEISNEKKQEKAGRSASKCVNINTAGEDALVNLPGIGPVIAARIVEYRSLGGPFAGIEALSGVKGIGPAKLEKLRPLVCF